MSDLEQRWIHLFKTLDTVSQITEPSFSQLAEVNGALGGLRLVQPFNWNEWKAHYPVPEEISTFTLKDCVSHITRIVRADRTHEGVLRQSLHNGIMKTLCEQAQQCAGDSIVPNVMK